jgi:hypothetical protein
MKIFLYQFIVSFVLAFPPPAYSQYPQNLDPWAKMARWESHRQSVDPEFNKCAKAAKQLALQLSTEKDCNQWQDLWIKNMSCAVWLDLGPRDIGFCSEYKNDYTGARAFYKNLALKYGGKECVSGDNTEEGESINCEEVAKERIKNLDVDYSSFPSDMAAAIEDILQALSTHDIKKILSYKYLASVDMTASDTFEVYPNFETFLKKNMPDKFEVLFSGVEKEDHYFPRQPGDQVLPCVASGPWGREYERLSFQLCQLPPREAQPARYYFSLRFGGCVEK